MRPILILLFIVVLIQGRISACIVLGGNSYISNESAVIIWDSKTHTEHFIRQAGISSDSQQVGFLVPTPTVPELAEADPKIFDMAKDVSQARIIRPTRNLKALPVATVAALPTALFFGTKVTKTYSAINSQLEVAQLEVAQIQMAQDVAGYHATVLSADNVNELQQWCKKNDFTLQPDDLTWLEPYVKKHWMICAFQLINPNNGAPGFKTGLVRLTFKIDQPFYPYSEPPAPSGQTERSLAVSILSDTFMTGKLAEGLHWPATRGFYGSSAPDWTISNAWYTADWARLAGLPSGTTIPSCLSTYNDSSIDRPGYTDLLFSPDSSLKPYREEINRPDLPPKLQLDGDDLLGLAIGTIFSFFTIYGAVRARLLDPVICKADGPLQIPPRSNLLAKMDTIAACVILIFGLISSANFLFLPFVFFLKVSNILRYPMFVHRAKPGFLHPRSLLSGRLAATWVAASGCLYVIAFVTLLVLINFNPVPRFDPNQP